MFTLTDTIAEKISQLLATATKQPALANVATSNYYCSANCKGYCEATCSGGCTGSCKSTCQAACRSSLF